MITDVYALTDKTILSKIGESIRCRRLDKNISQKGLATAAGVSTSSVAAMERGESVSLKTLVPVLRALGSLHLLSGFLEEPKISPIAYARLLENQISRRRASATKNDDNKSAAEW